MPYWAGFSDAELEGATRPLAAFVLRRWHDGFGLPVLEPCSAVFPVPVGTSALAEVAGDAALLFDAYDPQAIADCVHAI